MRPRDSRPSAYSRRGQVGCLLPLILGLFVCLVLLTVCFGTVVAVNAPTDEPSALDTRLSTPLRVHYMYEWTDDDLAGDYAPVTAACDILLKANRLPDDRDEIAQYVEPGATEALPVSEGLNRILNVTRVAVPIVGSNVMFLPAPSVIWIDDGAVRPVVLLYADEATVTIADPEAGVSAQPFSLLCRQYDAANRQAVYIADRGYTAESDM